MKLLRLAVSFFIAAQILPSHATGICQKGYGTLNQGEPCIPRALLNYLYCLEKSGGGKIEFVQRNDLSSSHSSEVAINGRGSGVVISGGVGGHFKNTEAVRVAKDVREKMDPSLVSNCKSLASKIEKLVPAEYDGKKSGTQKELKQDLRPTSKVASKGGQVEMESVDFILNQAELTDRSSMFLRDLAKRFLPLKDSHIVLVPEFRSEQQNETEEVQGRDERTLVIKRQLAIRDVLVSSGFQSDRIALEQGTRYYTNAPLRFNNAGKRIESGMLVQAWP